MSYQRFRPKYHFLAPHSWSNDPCGAVYIPETKEYIVCYQWNPGTTEPGNCAWGSAKSKNLVTWSDCAPALKNGDSTKYDALGVFSGSIVSRLEEGKRVLYLFYTSVSALPIHWSKPYIDSCESQSVCISKDLGKSWQRYEYNPLLNCSPSHSMTTGWRDPFVSQWQKLSTLLERDPATHYMLLSSGIKTVGPRLIIYESDDLLGWSELSVLLAVHTQTPISPRASLVWGHNFECASFTSIGSTDYLILGVEEDPSTSDRHCSRYTLWLSGELKFDRQNKPIFEIQNHGRLDYGLLYAPHIFKGANGEMLQLGWADEDKNSFIKEQGWAGCLTFPREMYEISRPIPANRARLGHEWKLNEQDGTLNTLGIKPSQNLGTLLKNSKCYGLGSLASIQSKNFVIQARFTELTGEEKVTVNVRESPDGKEKTSIAFDLLRQTISVDRTYSSSLISGAKPDIAVFSFFESTLLQGDLRVTIMVDNSMLEIFVNDMFCLTTRIYAILETSLGLSCRFTRGGQEIMDKFVGKFQLWDELPDAWPERFVER